MTLNLYYEWRAYARLVPFGPERQDWRIAMLAHLMASLWRGKNSPRPKLKNYLYWDLNEKNMERKNNPKTLTEMYQGLKTALVLGLGKGIIKKKNNDSS